PSGIGLGGRAEAAEPVRRVHAGRRGQVCREAVGGRVLMAYQIVGVVGTEQVWPTDRAIEKGPAGEDRDLVGTVRQRIREVRERRGGSRQPRDAHAPAHADDVAVTDGYAVERAGVGGVDVVGGARRHGQSTTAGDIVVVNVRLEHVGDPYAGGQR